MNYHYCRIWSPLFLSSSSRMIEDFIIFEAKKYFNNIEIYEYSFYFEY